MDQLVRAVGGALDIVEGKLLGSSTNHGKRVASLCTLMCKELGMNEDETNAIATCALFHDNALTEFMLYHRSSGEARDENFKLHCMYGQRNVEALPFKADIDGLVLYHHEHADGSGLFGKKDGEFPLGAQLIAIADMLDAGNHLQRVKPEELPLIREKIAASRGVLYTEIAADAMIAVLDEDSLFALNDNNIFVTAERLFPVWQIDVNDGALIRFSALVAQIIDYRSVFTRKHSTQIANRAWLMGGHYGFAPDLRAKVYLAASLHDIGKLDTPTEILEKPGKLTDDEFTIIKDHVRLTHDLLRGITGFEDVCGWASNHHEKLDSTGYSFGKGAKDLDFVSRLLVCTDIYQAVSEERPYHPRRSHAETMPILWDMAEKGFIDGEIVKDFDVIMAEYSNQDVPFPDGFINFL